MKTDNVKAIKTEPKNEAVIFADEFVRERVIDSLLATAGRASLLYKAIKSGDECLCSKGSGQAGILSILEHIEGDMFKAMDILENKEGDE